MVEARTQRHNDVIIQTEIASATSVKTHLCLTGFPGMLWTDKNQLSLVVVGEDGILTRLEIENPHLYVTAVKNATAQLTTLNYANHHCLNNHFHQDDDLNSESAANASPQP